MIQPEHDIPDCRKTLVSAESGINDRLGLILNPGHFFWKKIVIADFQSAPLSKLSKKNVVNFK